MSATLSPASLENPDDVVDPPLFCSQSGRDAETCRHSEVVPPHSRLSHESTFSRDSRLRGAATTDRKCSRSPGSHHLSPAVRSSSPFISLSAPPLLPFLPFSALPILPANWCCTAPFISPLWRQKCQLLSAASPGCC